MMNEFDSAQFQYGFLPLGDFERSNPQTLGWMPHFNNGSGMGGG
jgi:hypothetical protein